MNHLSSHQIRALAQMAIKQAKILRSEGLSWEARQLTEHGLALASSRVLIDPPRLVPVAVRR